MKKEKKKKKIDVVFACDECKKEFRFGVQFARTWMSEIVAHGCGYPTHKIDDKIFFFCNKKCEKKFLDAQTQNYTNTLRESSST